MSFWTISPHELGAFLFARCRIMNLSSSKITKVIFHIFAIKSIMERRNERLIPFKAIHPGSTLRKELEAREIKQKDFAAMFGMQLSFCKNSIKVRMIR